jgi:hypothetical protein
MFVAAGLAATGAAVSWFGLRTGVPAPRTSLAAREGSEDTSDEPAAA